MASVPRRCWRVWSIRGGIPAAGTDAQFALDEIGADRAADYTAGDDADHGCGHGQRGRAGHAGLFEQGREARPVAGPPVSVTDPAARPSTDVDPAPHATPQPTTFCNTATMKARMKNVKTSGPPRRSSARLAAKPIEAKKVFCAGTHAGVELQRLDAGEVEDRESPATGSPPHRRGDVHLAEDWDQSPDP